MKKVLFNLLCFLFIISITSCKIKETKQNIEKITIEVNSPIIEYVLIPSINNETIDIRVKNEVLTLIDQINCYCKFPLTIDYEYIMGKEYLSYIFKLYENKQHIYTKVLNFSLATNKLLEVSNKVLSKYRNSLHDLDVITDDYIFIYDHLYLNILYQTRLDKSIIKEVPEAYKKVSITFDDGPSDKTNEILSLLESYNVKATFFCLGENIKLYPENIKQIVDSGNEVANHSYSHPNFTNLSQEQIKKEISLTDDLIYEHTGIYPKLFRFPYGLYTKKCIQNINHTIILWSKDSLDWQKQDEFSIYELATKDIKSGDIILFHDKSNYKKVALTLTIEHLINQGFKIVTVSELLEDIPLSYMQSLYYFV